MAVVKCAICGGNVNTTKGNYEFVNNIHQHRRCPSRSHLPDDEKQDYKALTAEIKNVTDSQNKPLSPAQWRMVTSQIQKLKVDGFSYKQQLDAFKWYFLKKGNQYMGYGIMAWVISECLHEIDNQGTKEDETDRLKEYMEQKRRERLGIETT